MARRVDQHDKYWKMATDLQNAGATFFQDTPQGEAGADRTASARGWAKFRLPTVSAWIIAPQDIYAKFVLGKAPTGSGGAGGPSMGAQAGAATQSQAPLTGGGAGFHMGPIAQNLTMLRSDNEFMGLETLTPSEKLPEGYSPDAPGIDQISKIGSRCKRHGMAKMTMDRDSVTLSSSAIGAGYRGLSLCVIPSSGNNADQQVIAFADNSIGSTRTSLQTALLLVTNQPRWGQPVNLKDWPGPLLTLTQQSGPVLRVTAAYTNVFDASTQAGMRANSVVQIVIRYSTTGYPRDIDGKDIDRDGSGFTTTAIADRTAWTGGSTNFDSATLTATGKYWVTAWAISREGVSDPSYATLTIT